MATQATQLKQTQELAATAAAPDELDTVAVVTDPKTHTTTTFEASTSPPPSPPPPPKEYVGAWGRLKSWAMSGMTPADQEYKTVFEKARDEERKEAERLMVPIVVEANREDRNRGDRIDRLGADDLVKDEPEKGGSVGTLASLTGWWTGR